MFQVELSHHAKQAWIGDAVRRPHRSQDLFGLCSSMLGFEEAVVSVPSSGRPVWLTTSFTSGKETRISPAVCHAIGALHGKGVTCLPEQTLPWHNPRSWNTIRDFCRRGSDRLEANR